ncbi:MAG TPA: VOC family protein [Pseudogracilibacillus sp.]|nr:VOC family protein [Pseudogracilibacillus sp.]
MLSLDHIVFASNDVEKASKVYENKFSVKTVKGGNHENWGTYNYLAHFSNDCYIEWLGIHSRTKADKSNNPLIQHLRNTLDAGKQEAFQFALRTSKLDPFIYHFERINIPFSGPVQGKRIQPNGKLLTWRMLFPIYDFSKETLPFLIEWDQPKEERVEQHVENDQAITTIHFGGTTLEKFMTIYQLKQPLQAKLSLQNADIIFNTTDSLQIDFH